MVAYSFRPRFVPRILDGTKDQTIRAPRIRRHARPGEELQLYTGMRTRACRLIRSTVCIETMPCTLDWRGPIVFALDSVRMAPDEMDVFARRDGFADVDDMGRFWKAEHPDVDIFMGTLIRWHPTAARAAERQEVPR